MNEKVVLIGHCGPDGAYLRTAVRSALPGAEVVSASSDEGIERVMTGAKLALVNRVLDGLFADEDGIALIRRMRVGHPQARFILISNYPDAQAAAVAGGARRGFGKRDIGSAAATQAIKDAIE